MRKIMLVMYRKFIAQSLVKSMKYDQRYQFITEYDRGNAVAAAGSFEPDVALVEVPEGRSRRAAEYVALCSGIRRASPRCKLILFCPETSQDSKDAAIAAAQSGEIDDFVFFDTSWDYLISKLEALSPGVD